MVGCNSNEVLLTKKTAFRHPLTRMDIQGWHGLSLTGAGKLAYIWTSKEQTKSLLEKTSYFQSKSPQFQLPYIWLIG